MDKFLTLVLAGAVSGTIYSLIATGLVLTYSSTGIFNLAYGGVAFVSAFLFYELNSGLGWPAVGAALFTVFVFAPLLGLALDVCVFRPLARADDAAKIMATVGLLLALPALAKWLVETSVSTFGWSIPVGDEVYLPPGVGPSPKQNWLLLGRVTFDSNQLVVLVASAAVALLLWVFMSATSTGLRMRALVDRPELASLRRTDPKRTSAVAWMLGTMLAALAGVVGAPVLGSLEPSTYTFGVFIATAAAVIGGLRSIPLAFLGGMGLGVAQNLVTGYATFAEGIQGIGSSVPFVFLLAGLLILGRDRSRIAGTAARDLPPVDYGRDLPRWRRSAPWGLALAGLLVYIAFLADDFWVGLTARGLVLGLILLSFTVATGVGGMVSLAQTAFVTMAGLVTGLCINRYDLPFLVAAIIAVAAAMLIGLVAALPALRLGGLPLALATLALAFMGDQVLFQWNFLRRGTSGWTVPRPDLGIVDLGSERTFAIAMLIVVLAVVALVRNLPGSATGRSALAVRASPVAAANAGVSPARVKLQLFCLSAAIAGLGGVLLASWNRNVTAQSFPPLTGLMWVAAVVLFGIRRPGAAVVAGLFSAWFPQILSSGIHWPSPIPSALDWDGTRSVWIPSILFGLGAIQLARHPDGILSMMAMQQHFRRAARRGAARPQGHPVLARTGPGPLTASTATPATQLHTDGVEIILEAIDVHAGYGDVGVLHGLSVQVPRGSITAVVGPNGAGKTTFCNVLAGTVPVSSGAIELGGAEIAHLPPHARTARGLVLVPETRGIFPGLTVDENLTMWLSRAEDRSAVFDGFPVLAQRRSTAAGSLSGGEQQILALAPITVRPPTVLVADEPTLGLAPLVIETLMELFTGLRDQGVTIVLVEEKPRTVLEVADRIAVVNLGVVEWEGSREATDEEAIAGIYLGRTDVAR